jgi:kynureninase
VPHQFHKDEVDFATWCGYKYLNGGPGSSAFIYIHEKHFGREPLMAGWFGYVKEKQFEMSLDFKHQPEAGGWQISTPTLLSLAPLEGSLKLFQEAGMEQLRQKSVALTTYLIQLVNKILGAHPYDFYNGSPDDPGRRGGHVAVCRDTEAWRISQALRSLGFVPDFRPPNIIRIAPVALYNSFEDVWRTIQAIKRVVDERLYENFQVEMASVS